MTGLRRAILAVSIFCLLPLAAVAVSAVFAAVFGCELSEAGTSACVVLGLDVSGFLQTLFVTGWMGLVTLPILMGVLALWLLVEGIASWRRRRRMRRADRAEAQDI